MALTLKNVNTVNPNAGTEATLSAANLFNKAFDRVIGGTKKALDSNEAVFKDDSKLATQDILSQFANATPDNIAGLKQAAAQRLKSADLTTEDKALILGASNTADNDIANRASKASQNSVRAFTDSNALGNAQAAQEQTVFDRGLQGNKNAVATIQSEASVPAAQFQANQAGVDRSQAPAKNELSRIATQNSLDSARETSADTAAVRLINTEGLKPVANESLTDFDARLAEVYARTANIKNPDTREAQVTKLLNKNGLNKTQFANRLLESFPKSSTGTVDPVAFGAALNAGGSDGRFAFSSEEVMNFMQGKENISGATTAKGIATEERKINQDIDKQLRLQLQKTISDQEKPGAIQEGIKTLMNPSFFSINDMGDMFEFAQEAYDKGVAYEDIMKDAAKFGNANFLGNINQDGFENSLKARQGKVPGSAAAKAIERKTDTAKKSLKDFAKEASKANTKVPSNVNSTPNPFNR